MPQMNFRGLTQSNHPPTVHPPSWTTCTCMEKKPLRSMPLYNIFHGQWNINLEDLYSFSQEIIKVREWMPHIGPLTKVIRRKTKSARRWSNKWTKTLYQDYLHCIANFCRALLIIFSKQFISSNTKHRKRMLNFVWNTWKFWWNETDDEILPVFPQNH